MVVKSFIARLFRRYKILFLLGIVVFLFQILLALKITSFSKSDSEQKWQPNENSGSKSSSGVKLKSNVSFYDGSQKFNKKLTNNKQSNQIKLEKLNFTLPCDIKGKEAISAINRASSKKCKQLIVNITCSGLQGTLYPKKLPSYCIDLRNITGKTLGCFKDDKEYRILNGYFGLHRDNSHEKCLQLCLQAGFLYAGVEYSNECFCGSNEPSITSKLPDSSCNMACVGNPHEICGGFYTINIFHTGLKKFTPQIPNTESSKNEKVKIVFLLTLNGRALRQVKRLLKIIYHKNHFYYIHVDIRQDYLFRELLYLEKKFPNIKLSKKRYATIWGGASLLKMLRNCMNELLHLEWNWDFVLNLSESDYPVKTIARLTDFLSANRDKNFVKSHGREVQRFIQKQGLDKTFVECDTHMWRISDRNLPWGIQIDGGSDWIALNKNFVKYVAGDNLDELISGLLLIFEHTLLPAESFFHTALRNSIFCESYVDNNLHVTNWKRKLGCKCQYKHVVDWCGCSPNDFRPEDWPRILGTETRQLYFARKFEPIISQSVIYQLELWLMNMDHPQLPIKSLHSYWESLYHYHDLGNFNHDSLITLANAAIRNWLVSFGNSTCVPKVTQIFEIISYHYKDNYKYTLIQFKTTETVFEMAIKFISNIALKKSSELSKKIEKLYISSDYDQKEQISRNFAKVLGPYSDIVLIYQFSPFTEAKIFNISCLWIDPAGKLVETTEIIVEENNLIGHVKTNIPQPALPGSWTVRLIHQDKLLAELKFLILPLEFKNNVKISKNQSTALHSGLNIKESNTNFLQFLPNSFDKDVMRTTAIQNSKKIGLELKEWIDNLFEKFYSIEHFCAIREINVCKQFIPVCLVTNWSSFYPDPKSAITDINQTSETFDLWL